jgi:hypothetical protein
MKLLRTICLFCTTRRWTPIDTITAWLFLYMACLRIWI